MSDGLKRLLEHFARHLASIGHLDVAHELGTMVGVQVRPTVEGEGYSDLWAKPEASRASLLELGL